MLTVILIGALLGASTAIVYLVIGGAYYAKHWDAVTYNESLKIKPLGSTATCLFYANFWPWIKWAEIEAQYAMFVMESRELGARAKAKVEAEYEKAEKERRDKREEEIAKEGTRVLITVEFLTTDVGKFSEPSLHHKLRKHLLKYEDDDTVLASFGLAAAKKVKSTPSGWQHDTDVEFNWDKEIDVDGNKRENPNKVDSFFIGGPEDVHRAIENMLRARRDEDDNEGRDDG